MSEKNTTPSDKQPEPEYAIPDDSAGWLLAERAGWHLLELKAEDIRVLDLRGRSDVCDFFVVAGGTSQVHVQALSRRLQDALLSADQKARGVEGQSEGRWILLDFFDVVFHIFQPAAREYFQLEHLWGDAETLTLDPAWYDAPDVRARQTDLFPSDGD